MYQIKHLRESIFLREWLRIVMSNMVYIISDASGRRAIFDIFYSLLLLLNIEWRSFRYLAVAEEA